MSFTYVDGKLKLGERVYDKPVDCLFNPPRQAGVEKKSRESGQFKDVGEELTELFVTVPSARHLSWKCAAAATVAHKEAFKIAMRVISLRRPEDLPLRGEIGEFLVIAQRFHVSGWKVAILTARGMAVTVRMEDLVLALPKEAQVATYTVSILRDAKKDEGTGLAYMSERFPGVAWDTRIRVLCNPAGGAVISLRPEKKTGGKRAAAEPKE